MTEAEPHSAHSGPIIEIYDGSSVDTIPATLHDKLSTLQPLLDHFRELNRSEHSVQELQRNILRNNAILMPSPFSAGTDTCTVSYFLHHQFFFFFESDIDYFWISSPLDRGYCFATLYVPSRNAAVALYPFAVDASLLSKFDALRASCVKPAESKPLVVMGYPHFLHVVWNEATALERAIEKGLMHDISVKTLFEPFGPTRVAYPELRSDSMVVRHDEMGALNASARLLVGLGGWTISDATQDRLNEVSLHLATPSARLGSKALRARFEHIFWISIKPPRRTLVNQNQVLAGLILALLEQYPSSGVILNGTSSPWDAAFNPNHGAWFTDGIEAASVFVRDAAHAIIASLDASVRDRITVVSGVTVADEMVWASTADFYVCHGGTMQNKIGWMTKAPGYIHSNSKFIEVFRNISPVENGGRCFYPAADLIRDCAASGYTALELARKDQDYQVVDTNGFIQDVLAAYRLVVQPGSADTT